MTIPANSAPVAAVWRRRLAVLLAVAAALVTVRSSTCPDGMLTHMSSAATTASLPTVGSGPVIALPVRAATGRTSNAAATTPRWWCPALLTATGSSGPAPCLEAPTPAAANPTGPVGPAASRHALHELPPATAPPPPVIAVLRHAATLHQLGLLRT